jgi:acyl-CoA hydrolase
MLVLVHVYGISFQQLKGYIAQMSKHQMQDSLFRYTYTVIAADLNHYGIIHGGRLLTLCDEAGYVSAHRHAKSPCLTRAVHQAQFHHEAREGEELIISARIGLTGLSSIWVPVYVISTIGEKPVMDAIFVYVAVNNQQKAQRVPPATAISEEEQQTWKMLEKLRNQLNHGA